MQIVIDIDENLYSRTKRYKINNPFLFSELDEAVLNGTILPKGHGRLIDESQINKTMEREFKERKGLSYVDLLDIISFTPTIIEADKEE